MKTFLRWLAVLPGAILAVALVSFPLHFVLYQTLSNFVEPYPELPERILFPLAAAIAFQWAGVKIAPGRKDKTAIILFALWLIFCIAGIWLLLSGTKLGDIDLVAQGGGLGPIFAIVGAFAGLYINLFRNESTPSANVDKEWVEGFDAFETGRQYLQARNTEEALKYFDTAVDCGYEDGSLYSLRGSCLQELEWHKDAIEDFDKAIALDAKDCNNYFQRAISKSAIGDQEGCLADFRQAIELSKIDNRLNRSYNTGAREMGWDSTASMYEAQSAMSKTTLDIIWERKRKRAQLKGRRKDEHESS